MQLTVVFFLCVTSFVRIRGEQHGESILLNISEDETTACGNALSSIYDMARNVRCGRPREKLVTLKAASGNVAIFPSQVYIKRCDCDHNCVRGGQCVSVERRTKKQWVSVSFNGVSQKCLQVDLPEDIDCQCQCTKTAASCNEEIQDFRQDSCSCVCKDEAIYERECNALSRIWNSESCICECPNKMRRCSTGYVWSIDYCNCIKIQMGFTDGEIQGPITVDDDF